MIFDFLKKIFLKKEDENEDLRLYKAIELKLISDKINQTQEKNAPRKIVNQILITANIAAKHGYSEINFASFKDELRKLDYYTIVRSLSDDQCEKVIKEVIDILKSLNYKILIKPSITVISWK